MTLDPETGLTTGAEVYTSDGQKIGEVKEIRDGAFKVDAPMELDYWLPLSSVASTDGAQARVDFDWAMLGTYKMSDPEDIAGTAAAEEAGVDEVPADADVARPDTETGDSTDRGATGA